MKESHITVRSNNSLGFGNIADASHARLENLISREPL